MLSLLQIGDGETAQVWTSPAERTVQTADALVDALDEVGVSLQGEVRIENCLWEQDIDAFRDRLAACDADVVFAVGHNPFIEEVCRRVSGASISFATGAMAAVRLGDESQGTPVSPALVRPRSRIRLWKTLCFLDDRFAEWADELEGRLKAFLADPDEPETCHKLRVSIRTLRSLLVFCEPFMKRSFSKRLQRDLRSVVLELSRLRELDVFLDEVHGLENPALDLCAAIEADRDDERDAVIGFLTSDKTEKLMARILDRLRAIRWKGSVERNGLAREEVRSAFDLLLIDTTAQQDSLVTADAEKPTMCARSARRPATCRASSARFWATTRRRPPKPWLQNRLGRPVRRARERGPVRQHRCRGSFRRGQGQSVGSAPFGRSRGQRRDAHT